MVLKETTLSKRERDDEYWTPEDVRYVFTAWLKCTHSGCEEDVVVSGSGGVEQWQTPDEEGEIDISYSNYFWPRHFSHTPDIFDIPRKCPDKVAGHLRAGFRLFFLTKVRQPTASVSLWRACWTIWVFHSAAWTRTTNPRTSPYMRELTIL